MLAKTLILIITFNVITRCKRKKIGRVLQNTVVTSYNVGLSTFGPNHGVITG